MDEVTIETLLMTLCENETKRNKIKQSKTKQNNIIQYNKKHVLRNLKRHGEPQSFIFVVVLVDKRIHYTPVFPVKKRRKWHRFSYSYFHFSTNPPSK